MYGSFVTIAQMYYCVIFHNDGRVLSIVNDCTLHGTHVATICARNDGDRSVASERRLYL
jgi:hypothetical protein